VAVVKPVVRRGTLHDLERVADVGVSNAFNMVEQVLLEVARSSVTSADPPSWLLPRRLGAVPWG
jgi:hypothetical protein